jgi:hypothetical protein
MDRIDFFGSAVFVPIVLVSVGMLLQPSVMVQGETLKLAALFIVASVGGKTLAAIISKGALHLTSNEAALMLGLTVPQAAATLAATVIGFNIGLFDQSVVNAVLVLILVSIVTATLIVERVKVRVPVPRHERRGVGTRILVALEDPGQAPIGFALGARIAAPDSGVVRGLLACPPAETRLREPSLAELRKAGYAAGLDTDPALLVNSSLAEGLINVVAAQEPSLVMVGQKSITATPAFGSAGEAVAAAIPSPVVIVVGEATRIAEVVLIQTEVARAKAQGDKAVDLAGELATRIGGKNVTARQITGSTFVNNLRPGQVCIAPGNSWQVFVASDPPPGAALMIVLDPSLPRIFAETR